MEQLVAKLGLKTQILCPVLIEFALGGVQLGFCRKAQQFSQHRGLQDRALVAGAPGIRRYLNFSCFTFGQSSPREPNLFRDKRFLCLEREGNTVNSNMKTQLA